MEYLASKKVWLLTLPWVAWDPGGGGGWGGTSEPGEPRGLGIGLDQCEVRTMMPRL